MAQNHHNNQPNPETHLFAMGMLGNSNQYFFIDPTDPQNKVTLTPPDSLRNLTQDIIKVGNCVNGYLCFYGYNAYEDKYRLVMWNPIDGTTVSGIPGITPSEGGYKETVVGCGVCPNDGPKIVRIWQNNIYVCTVRSRTKEWRNVNYKQDKPFTSCVMECAKFSVNGQFIYMRAYDTSKLPRGERLDFFISFDFEKEVFGEVSLPKAFSKTCNEIQSVKVNGSLGLLEYCAGYCQVWTTQVEDAGRFSWLSDQRGRFRAEPYSVMTLRNNGEPVMVPEVKVGGSKVTLSAVRLLI